MSLIVAILMFVILGLKFADNSAKDTQRRLTQEAIQTRSRLFEQKYCDAELESTLKRLMEFEKKNGAGRISEEIAQFFNDLAKSCPKQARLSDNLKWLQDSNHVCYYLLEKNRWYMLEILLANRGKVSLEFARKGFRTDLWSTGSRLMYDGLTDEDDFWILKYIYIKLKIKNIDMPELKFKNLVEEENTPRKKGGALSSSSDEHRLYEWVGSESYYKEYYYNNLPGRHTNIDGDFRKFVIDRSDVCDFYNNKFPKIYNHNEYKKEYPEFFYSLEQDLANAGY